MKMTIMLLFGIKFDLYCHNIDEFFALIVNFVGLVVPAMSSIRCAPAESKLQPTPPDGDGFFTGVSQSSAEGRDATSGIVEFRAPSARNRINIVRLRGLHARSRSVIG